MLLRKTEKPSLFTKDGFSKTGDSAIVDDSGKIKITGRIKDIILRGGENISPAEIEGLVIAHPGVEDYNRILNQFKSGGFPITVS